MSTFRGGTPRAAKLRFLTPPRYTAQSHSEGERGSIREGIEANQFLVMVTTPRSDLRLGKLKVCSDQCEMVLGRREKTVRIDERLLSAD